MNHRPPRCWAKVAVLVTSVAVFVLLALLWVVFA